MRDAAEDAGLKKSEMRAYQKMGNVLQAQGEYKYAILAFKRMLQIAWSDEDYLYEMAAYQEIGMQYYYLKDIQRTNYYCDRS